MRTHSTTGPRAAILALLPLLALGGTLSACATPPDRLTADDRATLAPELEELGWLVGTWRAGDADASGTKPVQFEVWSVSAEGFLVAANFQAFGDATRPHQDMVLHPVPDGAPVLEVTGYDLIDDRAIPRPKPSYRLTEATGELARFEALGASATRTILYQPVDGGERLAISILVRDGGREREFGVSFERVE